MKNKILILLFLLLPICLLVWFAYKAQTNEYLAAQQHYHNFAHSQLKRIDEKIISYFQQLENTLILERKKLEQQSLNTEKYTHKIRQFLKYSPYILNIYIADKDKKIIYPSLSKVLSEKEYVFLSDIQVIINNQSLFKKQDESEWSKKKKQPLAQPAAIQQGQQGVNIERAVSQKLSSNRSMPGFNESPSALENGWIAWYQNRNLHHIFWFKDAQQQLYLLSLDRIRILSELIVLLSELSSELSSDQPSIKNNSLDGSLKPTLQNVTIKLRNSNNELIYEWGNYQLSDDKSIDIMLSYPLSSWKLSWYAKKLSQPDFSQKWSLIIIALLASVLMIIVVFLVYREYNLNIIQAQQKVNFVSQVSHELKTPLTNIRLYAELLENKLDLFALEEQSVRSKSDSQNLQQTKTKTQHFLAVIINESQRLSRLIENVLSFSKVQKQTFKMNKSINNIDQCIDNVLINFKPVFAQKNLQVVFDKSDNKLSEQLIFDANLLEQMLNNLLSNVDKYASGGKKVVINRLQTDHKIIIEIRDYGPGIKKNEQDSIFNAFYRSSSKLTEGVSGTGIGLTISRQLAILHGGNLTLKNMPKGACFIIELAVDAVDKV